jgi:ABC-2 type transport system permease protein
MRRLAHYLRLYFRIEAQYIKARMQYRADFIISMIGMFFNSLCGLGVFWILFSTIPDLAGWSFMEMVFIYSFYMLAVSPMQILFDNMWSLRYALQEGSFLKYYFRPLNMMFYFVSETFDLKGLTQLVLGIALFAYASVRLAIGWTALKLLVLGITLFSASLVSISLITLAACSAFWIVNSFTVMSFAWRLRDFGQYPLSIFDGITRAAFTFILPIGFVAFYPSQLFLRPAEVSPIVYLSPLAGVLLFALTYRVWKAGVDRYGGTGS